MHRQVSRLRAGLLVAVTAGMALSLACATGGSQDYHAGQERRECREIMRRVARAEQAYRAQTPAHAYTPDVMDLQALDRFPMCPAGGRLHVVISTGGPHDRDNAGHIVPPGCLIVRCNHMEHGVYAPDQDNL